MFTIVFLFTVLVLIGIYKSIKYKNIFHLINKIPGPSGYPVLGNATMFLGSNEELWDVFRKTHTEYYPMLRYWLGPVPLVSLLDPDDLETILTSTKHMEKGFFYKFLRPWLSEGLLMSTGKKWQHRRKMLTSAFHFNLLQKYSAIANENGKSFTENMRKGERAQEFELSKLCTNFTLSIICESAMGVTLDKTDESDCEEYKNAVDSMGTLIFHRALRPYILDWMLNSWTKFGRLHQSALKSLHSFTSKVLKERKEYHESFGNKYLTDSEENTSEIDSDDLLMNKDKKKKLAMLDLLLKAEKDGAIDEEGIREELATFVFAGHDTTGMSLLFTLLLLAEHTDIQDEARAEVTNIMSKNKGELKISEIQELSCLERCIKESLRLFPPVHTVTRCLDEDVCLRGYLIPKGTEIAGYIFDVHRNPIFWPEPTKYDPDRFLPENSQGRHPYSYIPFGGGPRNCIGQKFAITELKCILAHILYNFKLEPISKSSDLQLTLAVSTKPSTPVYTKFIRIDHDY